MGTQTGGKSYSRAKNMGAMVLNEDEAREVMRGEPIEVAPVGGMGTSGVDELMGEARSLVARAPDVHVWRALLQLFEV